jgi:hypothetical protein
MKGVDWGGLMMEGKATFHSLRHFDRALLQMAADVCLLRKEFHVAASILKNLLLRAVEESEAGGRGEECKAELLVKVVDILRNYPEESTLREIPGVLFSEEKEELRENLEFLYEKALHACPSLKGAWIAFGHFNYDYPEVRE